MEFRVDRDLPIPLGTQLRGLIEYGVGCGQLLPGEQLPSVREMADMTGVAPMTVALAWLLQRSPNILLIPGTSQRAHLLENVSAATLELTSDERELLDGIATA